MRNESLAPDSLFISGNTFQQDCLNAQHTFLLSRHENESPSAGGKKYFFKMRFLKIRPPFPSDIGVCGKKREAVLEVQALYGV